ncbi:MAG TPA: hypothetical protein VHR64_11725 [Thermomicrobiales bacterium]|nr:hypothetical protein [Thermomicrobiales bacterium]
MAATLDGEGVDGGNGVDGSRPAVVGVDGAAGAVSLRGACTVREI